jgi:hypothetical protein
MKDFTKPYREKSAKRPSAIKSIQKKAEFKRNSQGSSADPYK